MNKNTYRARVEVLRYLRSAEGRSVTAASVAYGYGLQHQAARAVLERLIAEGRVKRIAGRPASYVAVQPKVRLAPGVNARRASNLRKGDTFDPDDGELRTVEDIAASAEDPDRVVRVVTSRGVELYGRNAVVDVL